MKIEAFIVTDLTDTMILCGNETKVLKFKDELIGINPNSHRMPHIFPREKGANDAIKYCNFRESKLVKQKHPYMDYILVSKSVEIEI